MSTVKIANADLQKLLKEVTNELAPILNKSAAPLNKAAGEASPEASPEGSASAGGPPPEASASAGGPPPGGPDASAGGPDASAGGPPPAAGGAPTDPAADAGPVDPQQLLAEYASLSPEELQVHFEACKAALEQKMGGAAGAPPPGGPGAGGPPPAGPDMGGAGGPPPAMKAEARMAPNKANGGFELSKSEFTSELKKYEDSLAALSNKLEVALKTLDVLTRPMQKAVTGASFVPRTEEKQETPKLTRNEITAKLTKVTSSPTLAKSDREKINGYYNGTLSVKDIEHLLK